MHKAPKAKLIRKAQSGVLLAATIIAIFFVLPVRGDPQGESNLAPVSKECQPNGLPTASARPLPNTTLALRDRKVIRILTIGASSSAGRETTGDYHAIIVDALEKAIPGIDVQIIDRGVSGELVRDASDRMKNEVALTEPDLVLWQVGTNDAIARIGVDDFRASLNEGVQWLKEHDVDVVLVGVHYLRQLRRDAYYQSVRAAVVKTADEQNVLYVGRYEAIEMIARVREGARVPSEFAQTEAGYSCMAEYVARAITSGIFLKKRGAATGH